MRWRAACVHRPANGYTKTEEQLRAEAEARKATADKKAKKKAIADERRKKRRKSD